VGVLLACNMKNDLNPSDKAPSGPSIMIHFLMCMRVKGVSADQMTDSVESWFLSWDNSLKRDS
jgi:hypothetical protein